jgi:3'(2'), 5'-bisphosphate nucleotidase
MTCMTPAEAATLLEDLTTVAVQAIEAIQAVPAFNVPHKLKLDKSPVTAADEASEAVILDGLRRVLPGIPAISEEAYNRTPAQSLAETFLLIDPLDGTREFLAGLDEYAVNIAVVSAGEPVAGIIAAPALGLIWRGANGRAERLRHFGRGGVGECAPIRARAWPDGGAIATVSRSHLDGTTDAYLTQLAVERISCGSAIKFCRIAEGSADIYPRFGPTSEWDIAAGHAIVVAAGGAMTAADHQTLRYGALNNNFRVPGFIAWGDPQRATAASP